MCVCVPPLERLFIVDRASGDGAPKVVSLGRDPNIVGLKRTIFSLYRKRRKKAHPCDEFVEIQTLSTRRCVFLLRCVLLSYVTLSLSRIQVVLLLYHSVFGNTRFWPEKNITTRCAFSRFYHGG